MYVYYNPNPAGAKVNDCTVRAISKATCKSWAEVYAGLFIKGYEMKDMPASNPVWGSYLQEEGFIKGLVPDFRPGCYTIKDFADDHKKGIYVVGTGTHAVAVVNGDYFDTWDSGAEIPVYYYRRQEYGLFSL